MEFHVYRNNWEPSPEMENNIIGHLPKGKSGKYAKAIFYFLRLDPVNICSVKIIRKAVNLGENKGMRIPYLLQFTRNCKMMKIFQELIYKLL